MKLIQSFLLLPLVFTLSLWSASPIPYSGKIDIRGVNYFGEAQFAFSLQDGNATTHWRNGNQPKETIKVTIRNGRYNVLLGGQGMNSLPPELFLNHDKLYLKVEFDMEDGEGLRHLAPDQLITATPRALVADLARVSEVAKVAEKVGNGAITREMLSQEVLSQLDANATASPTAPVTITTSDLSEQILKYLKPEITTQPQAQTVYADTNASFSVTAEGKYLTYQWKKDGSSLTGETNATLNITDANATLHDGNYSVVVSNDFGSVETTIFEQEIISWHPKLLNELILWADASDSSTVINSNSKVSRWEDKSGLANHFTQTVENNMPLFGVDKINDLNALSGDNTFMTTNNNPFGASVSDAFVTMVVKIKNITDCNFINLRGGGDNFNERWGGFVVQSWNQLLFDVSGVNSPYRLSANIDWNVSDQIIFSFYSTVTGSVQQVWKNGSLLIGDSNTDASLTDGGIRIGNLNGFALGEVFIVNGQVSSHARIASEGYLAHKWGLSANLPSAHLYKNTAP